MDFFSGIFLSIAAWFGFGAEPPPEPVAPPVEEVQLLEEVDMSSEMDDSDDMSLEDTESEEMDESSAAPESEPVVEVETEIELGPEMAGEAPAPAPLPSQPEAVTNFSPQTMIVAGGCFWCVEADLEKTNGVIDVVSGYSGGDTTNPTYGDYGEGGHREVVLVTYDPNIISFEGVLIVTMKTTDPTDDDGTFADRGDKYSSAFYYSTQEEKAIIENLIAEVDEFGPYDKPLAIDVEERKPFWPAEDRHQDYYKGTLTQLKYQYYRNASGRTAFIEKYWGVNDHSTELPWRTETTNNNQSYMWSNFQKPNEDVLKEQLDSVTFKVTQKDGTERAGTSPLDKNWEEGIYVDILSGEPLFSSKDKFDSGTGWPSFVRPITAGAVTEHEDRKLFTVRTEIRSAIADNHLGHVFSDGPQDSTGLRYCMNGVALEFVPKAEMEARGYADFLQYL